MKQTTTTIAQSDVLTPRGAVEFLGGVISEDTLQHYRSKGGGPKFLKIGKRRVGYRVNDLQAWLHGRVAESTADARVRGLTG